MRAEGGGMRAEGGRVRQDLRARTEQYALRVIRLYKALPRRDGVAEVLGKQLLRSATLVAAHYREGCRAKSNADFVSKLEGALQELEESALWLELLVEGDVLSAPTSATAAGRNQRAYINVCHHDQERETSKPDLSFIPPPSSLIPFACNPRF